MPVTAGLHAVSDTLDDVYVNGVFQGRYVHNPSYQPGGARVYGTGVTIGQDASGTTTGAHADAVEFRTGPGGTLLARDEFTDLTAWTRQTNPGSGVLTPAHFSINPASHIHGTDPYTNEMYRTVPVGARYVELQGVYFDANPPSGGILCVTFLRNNAQDRTVGQSMAAGNQGHFLLIESGGAAYAGFADLNAGYVAPTGTRPSLRRRQKLI